ncbi:MAG TPA: LuxR C-terminal-related transcriptional regulator [Pilimelia sp.]|nr:LuxR C-terminal-related transcriptional regulator [Pilimelia sp.]
MEAITKVFVFGADPLSQAGMETYLAGQPGVELVPQSGLDSADVALVIADAVDEATLRVVRAVQRDGCPKVVLLVGDVDAAGVGAAVAAGAVGILRRSEATRDGLLSAIRAAAAGEGVLPPDLLGGLLRRVHADTVTARAAARTGPSDRELSVLRLLSEGCDTREIARRLCYSERTVKNVIQDLTRRFGVRNRSHAVAYALRQGLI